MSRTVTALYDNRSEAETALHRLNAETRIDDAEIIDQSGGDAGLDDIPPEDRHAYGEGMRRGGFLLRARVHSGENADDIVRILEESSSVDLDERQQAWHQEGWQPYVDTGMEGGSARDELELSEEDRIPMMEERLKIGRREVGRGGTRVRSYVREVPVQEQVTLREESVSVDRRDVGQQVSEADLASFETFQERVIEVGVMREEAVVTKETVVREEVVVSKTVEERVEQIQETVRRTEIEVEELPETHQGTTDRRFAGEQPAARPLAEQPLTQERPLAEQPLTQEGPADERTAEERPAIGGGAKPDRSSWLG